MEGHIDRMEYLEEEFNNNHSIGEIFKNQRHDTLDSLVDRVNNSNEDIVLQISLNNIMPLLKHKNNIKDTDEEKLYWDNVVSILLMNELVEKYGTNTSHNLDDEKRIMTRGEYEEYKSVQNGIVNHNDIIESIRSLNNPRVHIILECVKNENIHNELISYLDGNLDFVTTIYTDGEITVNNQDIDYVLFDRNEEGKLVESEKRSKRLTL